MFGGRNSPSKNEQQLTSSNGEFQRVYSNFSPINGGSVLTAGMLNGGHSNT